MSNETTDNFLRVMESFQWPEPLPVSYRLYYDQQGRPLIYTMEDLPGTYIQVDQATYIRASYHVRVIDEQLKILPTLSTVSKLKPDPVNGTACDPRDVCVMVPDHLPNQRWRLTSNDQD